MNPSSTAASAVDSAAILSNIERFAAYTDIGLREVVSNPEPEVQRENLSLSSKVQLAYYSLQNVSASCFSWLDILPDAKSQGDIQGVICRDASFCTSPGAL